MNKNRYLSLCKFYLVNEVDNVDIIQEPNFKYVIISYIPK